ncbi:MAG: RagB/SusD family nutrient uptake outer membrane protein [Phaeodactylibacter sp.]|uniref:RagB/SusD family nutrient uptake outer membrane protein n=1 Tax=Phaeodactylibacter sp. TaxID=1940289 RepID=UPI0032EC3542
MKKLKAALLVVLSAMAITACTDMLDQVDPTGPTGEDFFATENDLNQAVIAAYGGLSFSRSFEYLGMVGFEQFSDNVYSGSTTTDGSHATWTTFNYDPNSSNIERVYSAYYQLINMCNQVISRAPDADVAAEIRTQAIAEVTFLRGYAYFQLTKIFGEVPIVLEIPDDPSGFTPEPSPASAVYDQAVADLTFAEQNLLPTAAQGGRATSWAAKALLANVYLFGADELGNTSWYGLAESKAAEVINGGPYGLFDEFDTPAENLQSIYKTFNDSGKEHIFSVNHFNGGGNWSDGDVGSQFPMAMNPRQERNSNNMWGFGWAYVYEGIADQWDDADARKDYNIWFQDEPIIVNGDTTSLYNQLNQNRCCARPNGMGFQKFWYQESSKNVNGISTVDYPVLRYAELLLIHAEADLLADGTLSDAGLTSLNAVRARAGLPGLEAGDVKVETILEERRWELFGEAKRWFDFVRKRDILPNYIFEAFGDIVDKDSDGDDNDFGGFNPERHWKLPYPQQAIDRNPNLTQKPAWSGG